MRTPYSESSTSKLEHIPKMTTKVEVMKFEEWFKCLKKKQSTVERDGIPEPVLTNSVAMGKPVYFCPRLVHL
jgi:hypothetical protein